MKTFTKKLLALGLTAIMATGFATACTAKESETSADISGESQVAMLGGWQVVDDPVISDDAMDAFNLAMATITGVDYAPYALLATQVVSGTNYCFLCQATVVSPDTKPTCKLVYVYKDTAGNAQILNIADVELPGYTEETVTGGWAYAETPVVTDKVASVVDSAVANMLGAEYEAVALIGTQVVAGTNYAVLCQITSVTENPVTTYEIVYIYENLDGECQITSSEALDIAGLSQA